MEVFIVSFLVLFAVAAASMGLGFKVLDQERRQQVEKVLRTVDSKTGVVRSRVTISKDQSQTRMDALSNALPGLRGLAAFLAQSGLKWSMSGFLAMSAVLLVFGAILGYQVPILVFPEISAAGLGVAMGLIPYGYASLKRSQRMREFEEQFPEALDFLARSMRAGHAFGVSLGMTGEDAPNPLGGEFRQTHSEQNLGASVEESMQNLAIRIPLIDMKFFVSAVMLQREVGGNLAEILENLAHVIRERFRIKGQVRAMSAHGRITATALILMPILMTVALMIVAPSYLRFLIEDETGKYLLLGAILAQFIGFYFIRKIIRIKI